MARTTFEGVATQLYIFPPLTESMLITCQSNTHALCSKCLAYIGSNVFFLPPYAAAGIRTNVIGVAPTRDLFERTLCRLSYHAAAVKATLAKHSTSCLRSHEMEV